MSNKVMFLSQIDLDIHTSGLGPADRPGMTT